MSQKNNKNQIKQIKQNLRIIRRRRSNFTHLSKFVVAFVLVVSALMLDSKASVAPASLPITSASITESNTSENDIKIVFSDLDGTLIHYPPSQDENKHSKGKQLLEFPPSSTGLVGIISAKTLSLVDEIRNQNNVKFVLVSGMRTSTLLQRLPYLPRADAYCSENGGRIFYPIDASDETQDETKKIIRSIDRRGDDDDDNDGGDDDIFWIHPKRYKHQGNAEKGGDPHRNRPFAIREDKAWRKKMKEAIGGDFFGSYSLQETFDDPAASSMPLNERDGLLWDFARDLMYQHDFVLDTKGYATCFRVNKKQQTSEAAKESSPSKISAFLNSPPWNEESKKESIASSVNLSCVDFYPSCSGKKNCCLYLASKFFPNECQPKVVSMDATEDEDSSEESAKVSSPEEDFLSNHSVCMCDDDNDLEMALACQHAYLPDISSKSMSATVSKFPDHFTTTFSESYDESMTVKETDASDLALSMIW
eukprot:CAMPEP_0116132338 /NCGR_PEP_ID=MMETSP0329-20121206/9491_1 /TAXON_ID=697910 /ORGANISM="Pseudo-nitzschia arenysensis, Strain B593" /LENGTH=477 /DNA_ID=CAMNT_0003626839 /DNA_START=52 /DNA_END=1482 /DNA_ORIENTATION=+